eukprot:TRINITY_DN779932_c0_g1_i1.p1 TRINITY_DN779932_c0_g1~~TRINITY_DN779932_c0_g1_i1.p1  ORF type:complete len:452 (+),score=97.55 TRINITY_DN779932_c0_g1_i1:149-1504(+)
MEDHPLLSPVEGYYTSLNPNGSPEQESRNQKKNSSDLFMIMGLLIFAIMERYSLFWTFNTMQHSRFFTTSFMAFLSSIAFFIVIGVQKMFQKVEGSLVGFDFPKIKLLFVAIPETVYLILLMLPIGVIPPEFSVIFPQLLIPVMFIFNLIFQGLESKNWGFPHVLGCILITFASILAFIPRLKNLSPLEVDNCWLMISASIAGALSQLWRRWILRSAPVHSTICAAWIGLFESIGVFCLFPAVLWLEKIHQDTGGNKIVDAFKQFGDGFKCLGFTDSVEDFHLCEDNGFYPLLMYILSSVAFAICLQWFVQRLKMKEIAITQVIAPVCICVAFEVFLDFSSFGMYSIFGLVAVSAGLLLYHRGTIPEAPRITDDMDEDMLLAQRMIDEAEEMNLQHLKNQTNMDDMSEIPKQVRAMTPMMRRNYKKLDSRKEDIMRRTRQGSLIRRKKNRS